MDILTGTCVEIAFQNKIEFNKNIYIMNWEEVDKIIGG